MGSPGNQGSVLCASTGVEVPWIKLSLMTGELAVVTLSSGLLEHFEQSPSSMRWRSSGRSVKADPVNGEDREQGLMLIVNVLVEL